MAEIGSQVDGIPHLSPEEKAVVKPLEKAAWAKGMEILAGRYFCTILYGASSSGEHLDPNQLIILDMEAVNRGIKKDEKIDLIIQLEKNEKSEGSQGIGCPTLTEIYQFYQNDGGRVIKRSGISRDEDWAAHEANQEDLEKLINDLRQIQEDEHAVGLRPRSQIKKPQF